jgi:PBP1b-binding outer membrane lipoprotein LpoB
MKRSIYLTIVTAACSLLIAGCETTSETKVVDSKDKITSAGLDTQDFVVKGQEMVGSLLESGALDKASRRPAVIAVGQIVNNTAIHLDPDLLTKKIRVALNKGNKAVTDTTGGALNTLDFTFSGKIIDTYATSGNKRQHTYTFQMSLTDPQGLAVWEEEKEVTKLTKRPGFGY